jgi:hypothetical protein
MALPAYKQNEHRRLAPPAVALSLINFKCIHHSYSNKCIITLPYQAAAAVSAAN